MSYAKLTENPLIVAVFSALIGVTLTLVGTHLYDLRVQSKKRDSGLRVLLN